MIGTPQPGMRARVDSIGKANIGGVATSYRSDECDAVLIRPLIVPGDLWWVQIKNAFETVRDQYTGEPVTKPFTQEVLRRVVSLRSSFQPA